MRYGKRVMSVMLSLALLGTSVSLTGCGSSSKKAENGELNLFIWTEYVPDSVISDFEKEYGIKVNVSTFSSNEDMLAKVKSEDEGTYDIVQPSDYMVESMIKQEMLEKLDQKALTNLSNIGDQYLDPSYDPGNVYSVPYQGGVAAIGVNTDKVKTDIKGYKDLLNPELKGKIASADPTASSSAMMHIETILTDFGGLTLENEEGWNVVSELIKNLDGKLASGSSSAWKSVADGEMTVVLTYEEAGIALARSGANIAIVYPEEGTVLTPSTVGLIKNCSHPENGKLFIDFVLSQEVQNILCNELDVRPVRDDVSYPDYFRPASDIKTVDLDQEYVNQHKTEIVDKFTEVYQGTF